MQKNIITCNNITFKVTKRANKPFSNNFVMLNSKITQYAGQDEITAFVKCTTDSLEAGRIYACIYSTKGDLVACNTIN